METVLNAREEFPDIHWRDREGTIDGEVKFQSDMSFILYSDVSEMSYTCLVKTFLKDNLILIVIFLVTTAWLYNKLRKWYVTRLLNKTIQSLYATVKNQLREQKKKGHLQPNQVGVNMNHIYREYAKLPEGTDGLKRDESTFQAVVWPLLQEQKKHNKEFTQIERIDYGKSTPVWQLRSSTFL